MSLTIRILWADDQPAVQQTLATLLREHGAEIVHVRTGHAAIRKLAERPFDLVIVDLKMPPSEWGGLWLLDEIRRMKIEVASLVLSGEGTQVETIKALRSGACDYVTKDNAEAELADRVAKVLQKDGPAARLNRLLQGGENDEFECKETLRWNIHAQRQDKVPEYAVAKTLAAFANTRGGTLVVGIRDGGEVVGLEQDQFRSGDAALLHLDNIVNSQLGNAAAPLIRARFVVINNKEVLRIDCEAGRAPVYLTSPTTREAEFYVRRQASSVKLTLPEAVGYIKTRFG